jgi:branched-chain amino acid transport system substrate-binding protein
MMRRHRWPILVALAAALAGCASPTGGDARPIPRCSVEIAYLGPLSGPSANLGDNIRAGVLLAVERFNAAHSGCPVRVAEYDSQGDPKQAPALAQRLVDNPDVIGVVGPAFSGESESADPLLNQGGVAIITASATKAALSTQGWRTFHRIIGSDAVQGPAAGRFIATTLGARRVFVIDNSQAYGVGLADEVSAVLGTRVVQRATVAAGRLDYADTAAQIRAAAPDAIFFGGYYQEAGALLRQVRAAGVSATFASGDAVKDGGFLRDAGPAAEGAVITCACTPPEHAGPDFTTTYTRRFGRPPGTYSAEGYDAAQVFLAGIEAGRLTRAAMVAFVDTYNGHGLTGPISFDEHGELAGTAVTVWAYRVRNGAIVADRQIPMG